MTGAAEGRREEPVRADSSQRELFYHDSHLLFGGTNSALGAIQDEPLPSAAQVLEGALIDLAAMRL